MNALRDDDAIGELFAQRIGGGDGCIDAIAVRPRSSRSIEKEFYDETCVMQNKFLFDMQENPYASEEGIRKALAVSRRAPRKGGCWDVPWWRRRCCSLETAEAAAVPGAAPGGRGWRAGASVARKRDRRTLLCSC